MTAPDDFVKTIEEGVVEEQLFDTELTTDIPAADLLTESLPQALADSLRSNYKDIGDIYSKTVLPYLTKNPKFKRLLPETPAEERHFKDKNTLNEREIALAQIAEVLYLFINISILKSGFPDPEILGLFKENYEHRIARLPKKLREFLEGDEDGNTLGVLPEIRKIVDQASKES